jgi:hypothetical protein
MGGLLLLWSLFVPGALGRGEEPAPDVDVYVRQGCLHCAAAKAFLSRLQGERPSLLVRYHDIDAELGARDRLKQLVADHGVAQAGVPAFALRGELLIGYQDDATTGARLVELLDSPSRSAAESFAACRTAPAIDCPTTSEPGIVFPWIGRMAPSEVGLPLFTLAIGLLDGFNPCSMWVLLFMLSMLASLGERRKMLFIAGTFVAVEGVAYFLFMAAWLNAFLIMGLSRLSELALGTIGVVAGMVNIKDFWAFRRGMSLGIPESAKPRIYSGIRRILQADNLVAALVGTVLLALLVQVVELLCTAGLPALYTRILTMQALDPWTYYGYLVLYNAMYMLDDVVVLAIGVLTISRYRLQEREGRWLKLISGTVMIALGFVLLIKPDLLSGG